MINGSRQTHARIFLKLHKCFLNGKFESFAHGIFMTITPWPYGKCAIEWIPDISKAHNYTVIPECYDFLCQKISSAPPSPLTYTPVTYKVWWVIALSIKSSHQYQLFNVDARLNGCTARVPLSPALALSRSVAPLTANHWLTQSIPLRRRESSPRIPVTVPVPKHFRIARLDRAIKSRPHSSSERMVTLTKKKCFE